MARNCSTDPGALSSGHRVLRRLGACLLALASLFGFAHHLPAQVGGSGAWVSVRPGDDTGCGFDTPFEFWVREADPARLLVYLQGGGACFSHETCHPEASIQFDTAITPSDTLQRRDGIFDGSDDANPFRDKTVVFVPYCTGDFHLGSRRVTYPPPENSRLDTIMVNHGGARNLAAVLDYLSSREPTPRAIAVVGASAGAIASPVVAARIARRFPRATVRQVGDGVAGLRSKQGHSLLRHWSADSVLAAWDLAVPESGDAFTGLYRTAAARHPDIRFSQVATSSDARVAEGLRLMGEDPEAVAANVVATYEELREANICFSGYLLPGDQHTILWRPDFSAARVGGRPLATLLEFEVLDRPCGSDGTGGRSAARDLAESAMAFLRSLTAEQRAIAQFDFAGDMRTRWSYIPGARPGLTLKAMTPEQRFVVHDLLRRFLSQQGYLKVHSVMGLERYLQIVERDGFPRDPEAYAIAVFGVPGDRGPWGLRFEGHHVSLNLTAAGTTTDVSTTPLFLGANPARVPTGPDAGLRVLVLEEDLARDLISSLSASQRAQAIVSDKAPPDIFTRSDRRADTLLPLGLAASDLTSAQRAVLFRLIDVYQGNLDPGLYAGARGEIGLVDPTKLHFAWYGGLEEDMPHYYRIQGPSFLIEYDHVSNHAHTVWRSLDGDFGRDLLREHRQSKEHGPISRTSETP